MIRCRDQVAGDPRLAHPCRRSGAFSSSQLVRLRRWPTVLLATFSASSWIFLLLTPFLTLPIALHAIRRPAYADIVPPPKLEARIPVAPLGYRPPGQLYMLARMSSSSLDFIDSKRLLFTFHTAKLLTREQDAASSDDDQVIHATVLDLPDGRVAAAADWRMHDRSRYLWPLNGGKFLVRQGRLYSVVDASLVLQARLTAVGGVLASEVSPDGHLLVSEEQYERHTPEEHDKLVDEAKAAGVDPPSEDTLVRIIDIETARVLGQVRVELPVALPVVRSGYLRIQKGEDGKDDYIVRFVSFAGQETVLGTVLSACQPRETFVSEKVVMIESCGPNDENSFLDAWTIDGKKLWSGRRDGHAVWPSFALAQSGGRFAVGLLRVFHPIDVDDSLDDENVKEQMVQVFDVTSGAQLLSVTASPIVSAGQNFALSPDGNHLAVLRDGAIEVYAVPDGPPAPEKKTK